MVLLLSISFWKLGRTNTSDLPNPSLALKFSHNNEKEPYFLVYSASLLFFVISKSILLIPIEIFSNRSHGLLTYSE